MHELLGADRPSQADLYTQEFVGMTRDPVSLEELEAARERSGRRHPIRLRGNVAASCFRCMMRGLTSS